MDLEKVSEMAPAKVQETESEMGTEMGTEMEKERETDPELAMIIRQRHPSLHCLRVHE